VQLFIRVDASLEIGTGHVMRCLALARQWAASFLKSEIVFVMREHEGNLCNLVEQNGFRVVRLPRQSNYRYRVSEAPTFEYDSWLGAEETEDASQTIQVLKRYVADYVLVDHYAISGDWQRSVGRFCKRLITIDDLANREHYCHALIDSTPGKGISAYENLIPRECVRLIGAAYAMLREEFPRARKESLERRGKKECRHLLVAMGGVDKDNITSVVLEALDGGVLPADMEVSVVLGANAPCEDVIRSKIKKMRAKPRLFVGVSTMAEFMRDADLAIGAAGSMALERCCMGLPSIQVVVAENQIGAADALQKYGAALTAHGPDLVSSIRIQLAELLDNPLKLSTMSRHAAELVDGLGTQRIVSKITEGMALPET